MPTATLPPAPANLFDPSTSPRAGAFAGSFARVNLAPLTGWTPAGRLRRLLQLKRWQYVCVATPEVVFGCAMVNVGYAGNGFAFAADLAHGGTLADKSFLGLPELSVQVNDLPGQGSRARFLAPGGTMRIERRPDESVYHLEVTAGELSVQALLDASAAPPPLAVVHPFEDGRLNCTQKTTLMPATGVLRVGSRRWDLRDGFGGIDYTHGLLPRRTAWKWAFGLGRAKDGTPVGFNLTQGWAGAGEASENAIWSGRGLAAAPEVRFTFDANRPMEPWRVASPDGALDLSFTSRGLHREDRNLVLIRSRFLQVAGTFSGRLPGPDGRVLEVEGLPGVTEDQDVVW